ncbi:MAG: hypothetical protein HQM09_08880 [Candidatus Riflebacteria bacterium]|nr:hypothetical protein [Candidatus Riflebacteria bacterium]
MKLSSALIVVCLVVFSALIVPFASAAGDPLKAKVSLTKPYPKSYEEAKTDKISIQYAVIELVKQAGLAYDFKTSLANTNPTCKKYITPQIDGITLGEALDKILKPEGLGYEILDGKMVLKKLGSSVGAGGNPLTVKVSLTKPYPESYKGTRTDKISLQYAVIELAKQAGLAYDFNTSQANTKPTCTKYITPQIEGITLGEALDKILKPEGLGYEILDGKIVLKKL